jgi:hypothetical protein
MSLRNIVWQKEPVENTWKQSCGMQRNKKRQTFDLSLKINGQKIDQVKETMFLGVILDKHLSWKSHISHIASKISKSIGIIYKSSFFLSRSALRTLYYALIYLLYCIIIWGSTYPSCLPPGP